MIQEAWQQDGCHIHCTIEVRFISNLTPGSHSPKGQVRLNWCLIQDLRDWKKNLLMAMGRSTQNREICDFKSFKGRPQWNIEGPVRSDNPSKKVVIFIAKFLINRNHVGRVTVRIIETCGRHLLFSRSKNKRKNKNKKQRQTGKQMNQRTSDLVHHYSPSSTSKNDEIIIVSTRCLINL